MIDSAAAVRLYSVPEAMELLSMRRSVLYEQIRADRLRSVSQGHTPPLPATAIADKVALLELAGCRGTSRVGLGSLR